MHEAIFEQVNRELQAEVNWQPIASAGTSNWLYQGSARDQVLMLRVNAQRERAFGVCRQREALVLQRIQSYAWGMRVICCRPEQGWCVMAHHGLSLNEEAMNPVIRGQLLDCVAQLQRVPLPREPGVRAASNLSYPDLFEAYQQQLNKESQPLPWLEQLNRLIQLYRSLPDVAPCYTHHDLHPGNLCWQDNQLVLIDWEYAGIGNPWFDAAALSRYCAVPSDALSALPAFSHLSLSLFELGLQQAENAILLLEQLWFKVRGMPTG